MCELLAFDSSNSFETRVDHLQAKWHKFSLERENNSLEQNTRSRPKIA